MRIQVEISDPYELFSGLRPGEGLVFEGESPEPVESQRMTIENLSELRVQGHRATSAEVTTRHGGASFEWMGPDAGMAINGILYLEDEAEPVGFIGTIRRIDDPVSHT